MSYEEEFLKALRDRGITPPGRGASEVDAAPTDETWRSNPREFQNRFLAALEKKAAQANDRYVGALRVKGSRNGLAPVPMTEELPTSSDTAQQEPPRSWETVRQELDALEEQIRTQRDAGLQNAGWYGSNIFGRTGEILEAAGDSEELQVLLNRQKELEEELAQYRSSETVQQELDALEEQISAQREADLKKTGWYDVSIFGRTGEMLEAAGDSEELQVLLNRQKELEEELARYQYKEQQYTVAKEERMMAKDLEDLGTWTKEEQELLHLYAVYRIGNTNIIPGYMIYSDDIKKLKEKYGEERVKEIAESYSRYSNQQMMQGMQEAVRKSVDNGPLESFANNVGAVAANLAGTVAAPLGYLSESFKGTGRYSTLDPNAVGNMGHAFSGTVRGETAANIEEWAKTMFGDELVGRLTGETLSTLYNAGSSAVDNLLRIAAGGKVGSLALAATGSFGQTVSQASAQGADPVQAVALGIVTGGLEVLTEKVSLDNLLKQAKGGFMPFKEAMKAAIIAGGVEVSEEELNFLCSTLAEAAILQEKSAYNQQIQELVAGGMSHEEAKEQANRALVEQATQTAIESFLSGGMMSGATTLYTNTLTRMQGGQNGSTQTPQEGAEAPQTAQNPAEETAQEQEEAPVSPAEDMADRLMPVQSALTAYRNNGSVSGRLADIIAGLSTARQELTEKTGIEITGTKAQQRNAVRQAIAALAEQQDTAKAQEEARARETETEEARKARYANESIRDVILGPVQNAAPTETNAVSNPIDSYPAEKQNMIRSYIQAVDGKIKSFVERVKSGDLTFKRQKISDVSARAAADIERILGIDVSSYTHNINTNGVQHILKRHGANGKADRSMALDEDIARVGWVLENYDSVEPLTENGEQVYSEEFLDGEHNPVPQIKFVKKIDGSYYVVEAACENNYKKLWVQSVYLQKNNGDVTEVPAAGPSADHEDYARGGLPSPSPDNIIAEKGRDVNGETEMEHGAVGAEGYGDNTVGGAKSRFHHEVRKSQVYENTYKNATGKTTRGIGEEATRLDPKIAEYDYVSEKESVANARERVGTPNSETFSYSPEAVDAETEYLLEKEGWTGEDNDTAFLLLDYLMKNGDKERFVQLARKQKSQGTTAGQMAQSFAKYSRTPVDSAVKAVNELDDLQETDVPRKFYKKQGFAAWKSDVVASILEITNEIESIDEGNADGKQRMQGMIRQLANFRRTTARMGYSSNLTKIADKMVGKLDFQTAKEIAASQIAMIPNDFRKRSAGQIIKTIRTQNMLSALTTVNRNLVGNASIGLMDAVSDSTVGVAFDILISKVTGKRTVAGDIKYGKTYFNAAKDAAGMAALCAELDIPMESEAAYSTGKTRNYSPQSGVVGRFLSAYEKYLKYALEVSDKFFEGGSSAAVNSSLQSLGAASGLTQKEINALSEKAGRRRTFKEGRRLARMNTKGKDALNEIGTENIGVGDIAIPFAAIPGEVTQVGVDYSTLGIEGFGEMLKLVADVKRGKTVDALQQRKAVTDAARGITGAGLIAMFAALAAKGIIAVHDDKDKDRRGLEQSLGLSGAQLNVDAAIRALKGENTQWRKTDLKISVDFLEPFNAQMYIGYLMAQEEDILGMVGEYPKAAVYGIAQSVLDMPMMTGLADIENIIASLGEIEEDGWAAVEDAVGQAMGNTMTGFIPSWMRQTAEYIDRYRRDTSGGNAMEKAWNQFLAAVPGASMTLPEKYDGMGNVQLRYTDPVLGFFNTFISPGDIEKGSGGNDAYRIASYLGNLADRTGDDAIYPEYKAPSSITVDGEEIQLSGTELAAVYQKTYGENISSLYGALSSDSNFVNLPDDMKEEALRKAKEYATQFAKAAVSDYDDIQSGTPGEIAERILQERMESSFTSAVDSLKSAWREGKDDAKAMEALEEAYRVYSGMSEQMQKTVLDGASSTVQEYIEARESGESVESYAAIQRPVLLATDGMEDVTEAIKAGGDYSGAIADLDMAYRKYSNMTEEQKKAIMEKLPTKAQQFFKARASGVNSETFLELYETYYKLSNSETSTKFDGAEDWSHALQKAVEAGKINQTQANAMKENMKFWQIIPAEATAYNKLTDAGISADKADNMMWLLDGIVPQKGYSGVRDIQKAEAVLKHPTLTDAEKETVLKIYLSDAQDENLDQMLGMGYDVGDYVKAYRIYADNGKKADFIAAMRALGCSKQEAESLYNVFNPK